MRSLIVTTALTAILMSAPLAAAYAAPSGSASHDSHDSRAGGFDHRDHWDQHEFHHDDPLVDPMPIFVSETRLDTVLGEIHAVDGRIVADHRRGLLSPAEVRDLRSEVAMVRSEAVQAARNDGVLPTHRYHVIQRQIANLDAAVSRDARA
ncbi:MULTISPECIES: hypothetical protein [Rhizobium]|nr:hypothetical protein [Rhizobium sp. CC1099]WFU91329.1 hypothetical protein QA644_24450 [Rhizobium sp. CC1099]